MPQKTCARCQEVKPLDQFHIGKRYRDGHQSWCKKCIQEYKRVYRIKNADRIAAQNRADYERNKEQKNKYRRDYYKANRARENRLAKEWRDTHKEQRAAIAREYQQSNKAELAARLREWRKANPAKRRAQEYRRRGREGDALGNFTAADIHALLKAQRGRCVYCQADIREGYTVDHLTPLSRGGSNWPNNLQLVCASCNSKKNDRTHEEYLATLKR